MTRSPEQDELAASVRSLLAKRADSAAVRAAMSSPAGYDETLWRVLTEQIGAPALPIPEDVGGAGFSLADALVVLEEIGYSLAPSPLLASLITSAAALAVGATDDLSRVASGEIATLAWSGVDRAEATGRESVTYADGALTGTVERVLFGDVATVLVVAASTSTGTCLVSVDPSTVVRARTPTMDPTLRLATLTFDATPATLVADDAAPALAAAHRTASLGVAALQVGAARRALDMTVAYTKEREQFGRPLASFQALKHRMADLLVLVEMSRSALDAAIDDTTLIPSAASYCGEALSAVAAETIQLHGGIAITWEHDAHLIFKRAHSLAHLFGTPQQHRAHVRL